jgi:hypothetical protein
LLPWHCAQFWKYSFFPPAAACESAAFGFVISTADAGALWKPAFWAKANKAIDSVIATVQTAVIQNKFAECRIKWSSHETY